MTAYPWKGAQIPPSADIMEESAERLQINVALMRAVAITEGSGRYFDAYGVLSRFEPHHMPSSAINWRQSLKIKRQERKRQFRAAYASQPESALVASSWGAYQIMGFNAKACGYPTARAMVVAMAARADNHENCFVAFVTSKNLATHLRSGDLLAFASGYNGTGQARVYADKIRANMLVKAVTKELGGPLHVVIQKGSKGAAVKKLQQALGMEIIDGDFGNKTQARVMEFQRQKGLAVDGVVGHKTWVALQVPKIPVKKPDSFIVVIFNLIMEFLGK